VDVDSIVSVLGTTPAEITVTGLETLVMVITLLALRAVWKDNKAKQKLLDDTIDKYEGLADRYDRTVNKLNDSFQSIVTQMAGALFDNRGDKDG
jgi:hypothetical protein